MRFCLAMTFSLCYTFTITLKAQSSELYVVDLQEVADNYEVDHARYLSSFNTGGYTNQPEFLDLYNLLVTVGPKKEPQNTDLYQLDLRTDQILRITKTPDREYSPMVSMSDKKMLNCVVVDVENDNTQIAWQYPLDRSKGGRPFLKGVQNVGYFCELADSWVAVFEVGSSDKLWIHNRVSGEKKFINANVGRSLKVTKEGYLVYVHKFSNDYWFLKKVHPDTFTNEIIKKTIPKTEDFALLSDDSIIMGKGSKLFHLDPKGTNQWEEIADLRNMGINKITRLAFNGINQLAIVDEN